MNLLGSRGGTGRVEEGRIRATNDINIVCMKFSKELRLN